MLGVRLTALVGAFCVLFGHIFPAEAKIEKASKRADEPAPCESFRFDTPVAGPLEIELHQPSRWAGTIPKTRRGAHLTFVARAGTLGLQTLGDATAPYNESDLTGYFRDPAQPQRFPEPDPQCAENENCIADVPAVFFVTRIIIHGIPVPVLITGDAPVSTRTEPRAGDLPRTVWTHSEPVRQLRWTGLISPPNGGLLLFTSAPIDAGVTLDPAGRAEISRLIAQQLSS